MAWTASKLREELALLRARRGDSTSIEVKRAEQGLPKNCPETVCAFANMPSGGTLILGVDEARGFRVNGVPDPAAYEAALVSQARNAITPVPQLTTSTMMFDGKHVVIAEVLPLPVQDRPARYQGKAYLRQSDGDYVMHAHELRMVEVEKLHLTQLVQNDKEAIPGLTLDDLIPNLVEMYLTNYRRADPRLRDRTDAELLRRTGVTLGDGQLTLAGLYALGDYPQGEFPALGVTVAIRVPADQGGHRTRDLQDFTGPIPILLENVMNWVESSLPEVRDYSADGHIRPRPELPLSAVRELVANALVHRDLGPNTLGVGKSIQIRLTPDELFIVSPGGLRGVSIQQLESLDHAQAAVNQRLYNISKRLRTPDGAAIIEGEGGGIHEVFRACRAANLPRPALTDTGVQFKATLWRRPHQAAAHGALESPVSPSKRPHSRSRNEDRVFSALRQEKSLTMQALQEKTGLSNGQVRYALRQPLESGTVLQLGGRGHKGTVYQLSDKTTENDPAR